MSRNLTGQSWTWWLQQHINGDSWILRLPGYHQRSPRGKETFSPFPREAMAGGNGSPQQRAHVWTGAESRQPVTGHPAWGAGGSWTWSLPPPHSVNSPLHLPPPSQNTLLLAGANEQQLAFRLVLRSGTGDSHFAMNLLYVHDTWVASL